MYRVTLLPFRAVDSMKARPAGDGVLSVAGRNSLISDLKKGSATICCAPGSALRYYMLCFLGLEP